MLIGSFCFGPKGWDKTKSGLRAEKWRRNRGQGEVSSSPSPFLLLPSIFPAWMSPEWHLAICLLISPLIFITMKKKTQHACAHVRLKCTCSLCDTRNLPLHVSALTLPLNRSRRCGRGDLPWPFYIILYLLERWRISNSGIRIIDLFLCLLNLHWGTFISNETHPALIILNH